MFVEVSRSYYVKNYASFKLTVHKDSSESIRCVITLQQCYSLYSILM